MAITKQKGDVAEAFVTYLLKQNGFNVLIPWGEDNRYDLVSEKNGVFKRIQVKYATPNNGTIEVRIRSCNNYNIIHYSPKDIDIIAVYSPKQNKVYFVPLNGIKNRSLCKLRLQPARNKQKKYVVMGLSMNTDSIYLKNKFAGVAQLVELLTCNEEVARSIRVASFDAIDIRAGTQVAKGGRLCKRSVMPKGVMEK